MRIAVDHQSQRLRGLRRPEWLDHGIGTFVGQRNFVVGRHCR